MRADDWYVIQVKTGREHAACEAVMRACRAAERSLRGTRKLVSECFAPRYRTQFKLHGEWHDEERLLIPGYIVAVTSDPWSLARVLRGVSELTRLLTMGETFAPLSEADRSWIERWTSEGDRSIPMSVAYKEGDRIVVTDGPLEGHEAMITRVKRRQSIAEIEIHADQLTIRTTVGLAIVPSSGTE